VLPWCGHAENRAAGLFETESRYDFNECFAADLLQMQPTVILRSTFGCRTDSGVEHYGGEFVDLHQCTKRLLQDKDRAPDRTSESGF
jgi:hypothetical protein